MRKFVLALSAVSLLAGSAPSFAAIPCKDAKGKFIKCPPKPASAPKPAAKAAPCRDAKGKFIKCPTKRTACRDKSGKFTKCK